MKHTDAHQTLARIDATLRLTGKPLWADPEFLAWEAGQVSAKPHGAAQFGDLFRYRYAPGPAHWLSSTEARDAHLNVDCTVHTSPMVTVHDDHRCICEITGDPEWRGSMRVTAADYPAVVTHGPLMLGPA